MIILGIILLIAGLLLKISILSTIGIILLVIGVVLALLGIDGTRCRRPPPLLLIVTVAEAMRMLRQRNLLPYGREDPRAARVCTVTLQPADSKQN